MDSGVAHTLARHFFWNENVLWKKDVGERKLTVSLGGRDLIVNTEAVGRYMSEPVSGFEAKLLGNGDGYKLVDIDVPEDPNPGMRLRGGELFDGGADGEEWKEREWRGRGIDVLWFMDLDHAQVFDKPETRKKLIDCIKAYCEDGTDE